MKAIKQQQKQNFMSSICKNLLLVVILLLVGTTSQAQTKKNKNAKYTIMVNGNCDQCQKRIQKAAFSVPGVKSANWNIDSHQLVVMLNEEKASVVDVKKAVAKVGHDAGDTRATQETYDNLHHCCQYEREELTK